MLLLTYLGPYVYIYWRAQSSVFPTAVGIDNQAISSLGVHVDNLVQASQVTTKSLNSDSTVVSWTVAFYTVQYGLLNRIFSNYRNVPVLLDIAKLTFSASGVFNGTVIFQCRSYIDRLGLPTGAEFLPVYKSILFANNNSFVTSSCAGPGPPTVDFAKLSQPYLGSLPITLAWSISATVTGEMITLPRTWQGAFQARVVSY